MTRPKRKPKYAPGYPILPEQRDRIMTPVHMALAAIELGHGSADHYDTLVAFYGLAGELSLRMRADGLTREVMEAGRAALVSVGKRFDLTQKIGMTGPEMIAAREMVDIGDNLLRRANSAILLAIMAAVDERMREAA